jgi:signal transduction histidine kinase
MEYFKKLREAIYKHVLLFALTLSGIVGYVDSWYNTNPVFEVLTFTIHTTLVVYLFLSFHSPVVARRGKLIDLEIGMVILGAIMSLFFIPVNDTLWYAGLFFLLLVRIVVFALSHTDKQALRATALGMVLVFLALGSRIAGLESEKVLWVAVKTNVFSRVVIIIYMIVTLIKMYREVEESLNTKNLLTEKMKEKSYYTNSFALVSHHLKTPLSTALLTLDVAQFRKDPDTGNYTFSEKEVARLQKSIGMVNKMVTELVVNQKAVNQLIQTDQLDLSEVIKSVALEKKVTVEITEGMSNQINQAEAFSLRMALTTFIENSLVHAESTPVVTLKENGTVHIQDDGPGLSPQLFQAYGKEMIGNKASSGIGVYHTRKLLSAIGWEMKLIPHQGFCVELRKETASSKASRHEVKQMKPADLILKS